MWSTEAVLLCCLCIAASFLPPCAPAPGEQVKYGQECDSSDWRSSCGTYERCMAVEATGTNGSTSRSDKCACQQGYEFKDKQCRKIPPTQAASQDSHTTSTDSDFDSSGAAGGGSMVAFLLISTFLVLLGAVGYVGARRYKWLQRFRQFHQNRYGSVLVTRDDYEDDDPTLA